MNSNSMGTDAVGGAAPAIAATAREFACECGTRWPGNGGECPKCGTHCTRGGAALPPAPPAEGRETGEWWGGKCPKCGEAWATEEPCGDYYHTTPRTLPCGCTRLPAYYGTRLVTACEKHRNLLPPVPPTAGAEPAPPTVDAREVLRDLLELANRAAKAHPWEWKDHACAECGGTINSALGFRCARHLAAAITQEERP